MKITLAILGLMFFLGCSKKIDTKNNLTTKQVAKNISLKSCEGSEKNTTTNLWAQRVVSSDLSLELIKSTTIDLSQVKVAVIDTGFAYKRVINSVDVSKLETEYTGNQDFSINPNTDIEGHGTMVSGAIVGKHGIGLAPGVQLKVFSIFPDKDKVKKHFSELSPDDKNQFQEDYKKELQNTVYDTALKACNEGFRIINVSLGETDWESTTGFNLPENKTFFEELETKGCIFVNASGNASYQSEKKKLFLKNNSYNSLLEVGSISTNNVISSFSTFGSVYAPGENIFTLSPQNNNCKLSGTNIYGEFTSGTSVAAPFVSATLALVQATLNSSQSYRKLERKKQLAVWNEIIKKSQFNNHVNSFKAMKFAFEKFNDNKLKLKEKLVCREKTNFSCELKSNLDCIKEYKHLLLSCEKPNKNYMYGIAQQLMKRGNYDLATYWLSVFLQTKDLDSLSKKNEATKLAKVVYESYLRDYKNDRSLFKKSFDIISMSHLLRLIVRNENVNKQWVIENLKSLLGKDSGFKHLFNLNENRFGSVILSEVANLFLDVNRILSPQELFDLFQTISKEYSVNLYKFTFDIRLLNVLIKENSAYKDVETKYLVKYFNKIIDIDPVSIANNNFLDKKDLLLISNIDSLTPSLKRNSELFEKYFKPFLTDSDEVISISSNIPVMYLLHSSNNELLKKYDRGFVLMNLFNSVYYGKINTKDFNKNHHPLDIDSILSYVNDSYFSFNQDYSYLQNKSYSNEKDFYKTIQDKILQSPSLMQLTLSPKSCYHRGFQNTFCDELLVKNLSILSKLSLDQIKYLKEQGLNLIFEFTNYESVMQNYSFNNRVYDFDFDLFYKNNLSTEKTIEIVTSVKTSKTVKESLLEFFDYVYGLYSIDNKYSINEDIEQSLILFKYTLLSNKEFYKVMQSDERIINKIINIKKILALEENSHISSSNKTINDILNILKK